MMAECVSRFVEGLIREFINTEFVTVKNFSFLSLTSTNPFSRIPPRPGGK